MCGKLVASYSLELGDGVNEYARFVSIFNKESLFSPDSWRIIGHT